MASNTIGRLDPSAGVIRRSLEYARFRAARTHAGQGRENMVHCQLQRVYRQTGPADREDFAYSMPDRAAKDPHSLVFDGSVISGLRSRMETLLAGSIRRQVLFRSRLPRLPIPSLTGLLLTHKVCLSFASSGPIRSEGSIRQACR